MRSAPGTHVWLLIILGTSLVIAFSGQGMEHFLLHRNSSNLYELDQHPAQSLLLSAFWIENPASLPTYVLLFEIVHARVERWLGTLRWLFVVVTAHIVATLVSQKVVLIRIENHDASRRLMHVVDIGVSYGLAASAGVLTYLVPGRWKWLYALALIAFFGVPLATGGTFTDLGHALALTIGFACWPLTRRRRSTADGRGGGRPSGRPYEK